jgi:transcriptional regulator with XRE-family HTH domain
MDTKQKFGLIIKECRQRDGISQERLAELAGLHRTYISDVERGERNVSLENIEKIALALHIKLSELFSLIEGWKK